MKLAFGLAIAVCLGIFCRFFGIPLPGPPAIMGAFMAVAMASGYTATDYVLSRRAVKPSMSAATLTVSAVPAAEPLSKVDVVATSRGDRTRFEQKARH